MNLRRLQEAYRKTRDRTILSLQRVAELLETPLKVGEDCISLPVSSSHPAPHAVKVDGQPDPVEVVEFFG